MSARLLLLLCSASVTSLVRLIVNEKILDRPRKWWTRNAPKKLVQMLTCPWCVSFWIAIAVTVAADLVESVPLPVLWQLAVWRLGVLLYWVIEVAAKYGLPDDDFEEVDDEDA